MTIQKVETFSFEDLDEEIDFEILKQNFEIETVPQDYEFVRISELDILSVNSSEGFEITPSSKRNSPSKYIAAPKKVKKNPIQEKGKGKIPFSVAMSEAFANVVDKVCFDNCSFDTYYKHEVENNPNCFQYSKLEYCLLGAQSTSAVSIRDHLWVGDTGSSAHLTNNMEGMHNVKEVNIPINMGNGKAILLTARGDKRLQVEQIDGSKFYLNVEGVLYGKKVAYNLFSITKALQNGAELQSEGKTIILKKNNKNLHFDRILKSPNGFVRAVQMTPIQLEAGAAIPLQMGSTLSYIQAHKILGHAKISE